MRVPLYQRNQINLKQKANSILCESVKVTQNSALAENPYKRLAPFLFFLKKMTTREKSSYQEQMHREHYKVIYKS